VAATPWGAPTTPVEQGWWPTHRVPPTGLPAWTVPDAQLPPATVLDPWLDVQVLEWAHGWAHVRCANTWECWVDGRLLEQVR